jgi:hypothetical protein
MEEAIPLHQEEWGDPVQHDPPKGVRVMDWEPPAQMNLLLIHSWHFPDQSE